MDFLFSEAAAYIQVLKDFWFISCPVGVFVLFRVFGTISGKKYGEAEEFDTAANSKIARVKLFAKAKQDGLDVQNFSTEEDGSFKLDGQYKNGQYGAYFSVDEAEFKDIDDEAEKKKGWWQ